ncbi:MAG: ankyrin repeat domain-containing protein [Synergistaceae bacterium]|nr:ankyrin repeat domain-containing protein [Synergistaceae bacterium]
MLKRSIFILLSALLLILPLCSQSARASEDFVSSMMKTIDPKEILKMLEDKNPESEEPELAYDESQDVKYSAPESNDNQPDENTITDSEAESEDIQNEEANHEAELAVHDMMESFDVESSEIESNDFQSDDKHEEVYVSQIKPDDFMRMCAGSDSVVILNAVTNRNADVHARDYYDVTPLMFAAEKNPNPEVIEILIDAGADSNAQDKDGKTALMYAAKSNPVPEIITALVDGGAKPNARDTNRMTAIMYAARNNNADVVKALIDSGAEELADKRGWTPLFWAARYTQYPEVIGVLLDAGHDPQVRAHDMALPLDHANKNPRLMNTKEFLRLEKESR